MRISKIFNDLIKQNKIDIKNITKENIEDIVNIILQEKEQGNSI